MKQFGWSNISVMGFVLSLSVNGYQNLSVVLGLVMMLYFYLKFNKWINLMTLLSSLVFSVITCLSFWQVGLLTYSTSLIVVSLYLGLNMGLFLTILLKSSTKKIEDLMPCIYFYAIALIGFLFLILVLPNQLLSYFLYPYYLEGGFKEALFVIVSVIFTPYVLMYNGYQLFRWIQGATTSGLVSTKNVIQ